MISYIKMEIKAIKRLALPPKKCAFKVKSLTMLLYALGIDKHMEDDLFNWVTHKIRLEPLSIYRECTGGFTPYIGCTMRMNLDNSKWSRPPGSGLARK